MKRYAAAAERNREPIFAALQSLVGAESRVLEIGSGTGQHAAFFTEHAPGWTWQPTDRDPANLASIDAYRAESARSNLLPPIALDASSDAWPTDRYDLVFCANVIHIAPWSVGQGLFAGAARVLGAGGRLALYGPFRFSGRFSAGSNAAFDTRLRDEDPDWGVRDLDDLAETAAERGFLPPEIVPLPANNHLLVFRR